MREDWSPWAPSDDLWAPSAHTASWAPCSRTNSSPAGAQVPTTEPRGGQHAVDHEVPLTPDKRVLISESHGDSLTGGSLWPASFVLTEYISSEGDAALCKETFSALRAVELGSGCGLCGLAAAKLGATVVLTDLAEALPHLAANVALNGFARSPRVEVAECDWNAASSDALAQLRSRHFDVALASECIYDPEMVLPLLRMLHTLSQPHTSCYVAGIIGGAAMTQFRRLAPRFFGSVVQAAQPSGADIAAPRAVHRLVGRRAEVDVEGLPWELAHAARLHCDAGGGVAGHTSEAACTMPSGAFEVHQHLLGARTWNGANVLAAHLKRPEWEALLRRGCSVLELGSGTGVAGLAAAAVSPPAASVVLTDGETSLVATLAASIADRGLQACCRAAVYEWGVGLVSDLALPRLDLVLGAECLYSHATAHAFCEALDHLVAAGAIGGRCRVLISCEERCCTQECLDLLAARGWKHTLLSTTTTPPMPTERVPALVRVLELSGAALLPTA